MGDYIWLGYGSGAKIWKIAELRILLDTQAQWQAWALAATEMKFSHAAAKVPKLNDVKQVKCKLWWHKNSKSNFYKGLWSKLNSKFQNFFDSLDLKPSANIFIIKFGNAIWHLTSNGNLFLLKYNTV